MSHKEKITSEISNYLRLTLDSCPDGVFEMDEKIQDVETRNKEGKIIIRHEDGDFEVFVTFRNLE